MPQFYRFIVHPDFKKQHDEFIEQNPRLKKSLFTQYRKATTNPVTAGKPMARIPIEELQGKIYRLYIGGRKKYRFVYFFSKHHSIVLPAWISLVLRSELDYDREDWLGYARCYWNDLMQGNINEFDDWTDVVLRSANLK